MESDQSSVSSKTYKPILRLHTYPTPSQKDMDSYGGRVIMLPNPPKVMRSINLQGQIVDPYRANSFRPNYPSNSRLLKYRPHSSRPFSKRSQILFQTSMQRDNVSLE